MSKEPVAGRRRWKQACGAAGWGARGAQRSSGSRRGRATLVCCAEDLDVQKECDGKPAMAAIEAAAVAAVGGGWVVNEHGENSPGNAAPTGNDACKNQLFHRTEVLVGVACPSRV